MIYFFRGPKGRAYNHHQGINMAMSIKYDNDFIVGGQGNPRLTPNFKLNEFLDSAGKVLVHRELVAGLQILRDNHGESISIQQVDPAASFNPAAPGLAVVVTTDAPDQLLKQADKLVKSGYFKRTELKQDRLYLEIPDPQNLPSIAPATAFDCGVRVTAAFETSGDPYQQVTGNFDGAGLSFGPIQCNLGTGTLQELFRRLRGENEAKLKLCFSNVEDYEKFWQILNGSNAKAVQWADALTTGTTKHGFSQPWKGYLQAVGQEAVFREAMLRYAYDKYGKLLMSTLAFLSGLSPIRITNLRCLAALYDMGVQQGGLHKAHAQIRRRVASEQPSDEFALSRITVEERAKKASARWRADCLSRRLCILERRPVSVSLDGQRARRSNLSSYLLRNSPVRGLEQFLEG
jgi:hypothetical protein